jgi:hypothetical protein
VRNRDREDSDGRPDRTIEEVQEWAVEHDLPCDDEEYEHFSGRDQTFDDEGR